MKNISSLHDCYGCGVCVKACPVNIISLKENSDGFYSPVIEDTNKCIECGRCVKVCGFSHSDVEQACESAITYAAWSNDENVRFRCSSGGIGFEIGRRLIESGYSAIGVRYNPATNRAEHFVARDVESFMPSVGSKYIPSETTEALSQLDPKQRYLVTGTPCQIDSFRRYLKMMKKEENFVLLDFFCHGVPSLLLWDKYTDELKQKIGDITFASWRNKTTGWHDSWSVQADSDAQSIDWHDSYNLLIKEKKHLYTSRMSQGDLFYKFFLDNYCLNKCCYKSCKYKMNSSAADIRIGDLWGTAYISEQKGVSAVLAFTQRGVEVLESLHDSCTFVSVTPEVAMEGQMCHNALQPPIRDKVVAALKTQKSLSQINKKIIERYRLRFLTARIANKFLRMLCLNPTFRTR